MIELAEKKRFLNFIIQSVTLKARESYWILNYLINHEIMLNKVVFVEQALHTPRGLVIVDEFEEGPGIEMTKQGLSILDANAIFHEIRMNRKEMLYIEIKFKDRFKKTEYLSILEKNEYEPIDEDLQLEILEELETFFIKEDRKFQLNDLEERIDLALEKGNEAEFIELSNRFKQLKKDFISN